MARRLLSLLVAAALAAPAACAQDDGLPPPRPEQPVPNDEPEGEEPEEVPEEVPPPEPAPERPAPPPVKPAPDGEHRARFKREQGTADALKAQLERTLAALKASDPALGELVRALAPTPAALADAFTDAGHAVLAPRLEARAAQLFAGEPAEIARRLGLRPELEQVEVFTASTEDLLTMDLGSDAAREFASGLRRTAQHLEPRYVWYCAVLKPTGPDADDPTKVTRLQLFFFHRGAFVLLGRVWRIEGE